MSATTSNTNVVFDTTLAPLAVGGTLQSAVVAYKDRVIVRATEDLNEATSYVDWRRVEAIRGVDASGVWGAALARATAWNM